MASPRSLGSRSVTSRSSIDDPAVGGLQQPGEQIEERGLAAAGGPEQHQELAVPDAEIEVLEHVSRPKRLTRFSKTHARHRLIP